MIWESIGVLGLIIVREFMKDYGGMNVKTVKSMNLPQEEVTAVMGTTRHGKSYAVIHSIEKENQGAFFFNTLHTPTTSKFIRANENTPYEIMFNALKKGKKIDYRPGSEIDDFSKDLEIFIKNLYSYGDLQFRFVIDEVHLFNKNAVKSMQRLSTAGLRYGYQPVFISQRPALIDNTLLSQCNMIYSFNLNVQDKEYLRNYKLPIDEMMERIGNEKYLYVTFDQMKVEGAYKIG